MNKSIVRAGLALAGLAFSAVAAVALIEADQIKVTAQKTLPLSDKISIHGHVKAPDGRPLQGIGLTLYSNAGPVALDINASTNAAGFYSFAVDKALVGRTFQLTPTRSGVPEASFDPNKRFFSLTANPGPLDFTYQSPLPDLTCSQANIFFETEGQSRHDYIQVTVLNRINNGQGLAAGPFKVRAVYEDRTVNPWKMREAIFPVASLEKGLTHVEGRISIGVYPPQAFFRLAKVEVDIENAVIELDEGNNTRIFN